MKTWNASRTRRRKARARDADRSQADGECGRPLTLVWGTEHELQILHMTDIGHRCGKHHSSLAAIDRIIINRFSLRATVIPKAGGDVPSCPHIIHTRSLTSFIGLDYKLLANDVRCRSSPLRKE